LVPETSRPATISKHNMRFIFVTVSALNNKYVSAGSNSPAWTFKGNALFKGYQRSKGWVIRIVEIT
jgi:hypothetical protein